MLHQPDPEKAPDLYAGILSIRKMHLRAMEETGLTAADEMPLPGEQKVIWMIFYLMRRSVQDLWKISSID